jgi:error-prone DNA polymerase
MARSHALSGSDSLSGKALGFEAETLDALAKGHQWWDGKEIAPERLAEAGLSPESLKVRQLLRLTSQLLGFPRHLSQHVGGFVLTRGPLSRMVPIENAAMEDRTVIEWDKDGGAASPRRAMASL